jgi:hypothetical protein
MQVAQRGTSFTGLQNSPAYTVDRFEYRRINSWSTAQFAVTQESDGPAGFANSIKLATTTAETDTTSIAALSTMLEGQDLQQLKYGTASAESMTLSFWVKSYQTGTYSFVIQATDLNNAIYGSLYTINSSNTWEKKTITIPAPSLASSTAIANDNTLGFELIWQFTYRDSAGTLANNSWNDTTATSSMRWYSVNGQSINGSTSTNNYIQITGVKLEVGSVATEFDHRSYGEELQLCKRYYQLVESASGMSANTTVAQFNVPFSVEMRSAPTVSISDVNGVTCARITDHAYTDYTVTSGATIVISNVRKYGSRTQIGGFTGLTQGRFVGFLPGGSYSSFMRFDAEL